MTAALRHIHAASYHADSRIDCCPDYCNAATQHRLRGGLQLRLLNAALYCANIAHIPSGGRRTRAGHAATHSQMAYIAGWAGQRDAPCEAKRKHKNAELDHQRPHPPRAEAAPGAKFSVGSQHYFALSSNAHPFIQSRVNNSKMQQDLVDVGPAGWKRLPDAAFANFVSVRHFCGYRMPHALRCFWDELQRMHALPSQFHLRSAPWCADIQS